MRIGLTILAMLATLSCDDHPCRVSSSTGLEELDQIAVSALNAGVAGEKIRADGRLVVNGIVPGCPKSSSCTDYSRTDCTIEPVADGVL